MLNKITDQQQRSFSWRGYKFYKIKEGENGQIQKLKEKKSKERKLQHDPRLFCKGKKTKKKA